MIFTIAGIGMLVAVVQTILKQAGKEDYGLWVVIAGSIAVFLLVVQRVGTHRPSEDHFLPLVRFSHEHPVDHWPSYRGVACGRPGASSVVGEQRC